MSAAHTVPHTRILHRSCRRGCPRVRSLNLTPRRSSNRGSRGVAASRVPDAGTKWVHGREHVTKPVGDIFLNLLFMAIIPLVFASLALGVTRLGGRTSAASG